MTGTGKLLILAFMIVAGFLLVQPVFKVGGIVADVETAMAVTAAADDIRDAIMRVSGQPDAVEYVEIKFGKPDVAISADKVEVTHESVTKESLLHIDASLAVGANSDSLSKVEKLCVVKHGSSIDIYEEGSAECAA